MTRHGRGRPGEQQTAMIISHVLRGGVLLSDGLIAFGAWRLFTRPQQDAAFSPPHTLAAIWQGLWQGEPEAAIMAGIVILLLTPMLRVAISAIAFALESDWRYVAITLLVLGVLVASFLLGKGGV